MIMQGSIAVQAHRLQITNLGSLFAQLTRAQTTLAYEEISAAPVSQKEVTPAHGVMVHGLLGAGKNWEWRILLVDLRHHGKSAGLPGFSSPNTMEAAAEDLAGLIKNSIGKIPEFVAGHSMGGKVVMEFARISGVRDTSIGSPKQVWVLDSQPGNVASGRAVTSDVDKVIKEIQAIPEPVPSREWLYDHMQSKGFSLGLAQWLGSNLAGNPKEPLKWMFNARGALEMYESYKVTDCYPLLRAPPKGTTINVVRAADSDRWYPEMIQELEDAVQQSKGQSGITNSLVLKNAGHWLHMDNPKGLLEMMLTKIV